MTPIQYFYYIFYINKFWKKAIYQLSCFIGHPVVLSSVAQILKIVAVIMEQKNTFFIFVPFKTVTYVWFTQKLLYFLIMKKNNLHAFGKPFSQKPLTQQIHVHSYSYFYSTTKQEIIQIINHN